MSTPVTKFTIDRSKWARRGKNGESALLNADGNMCCLGFAGKACGIEDADLLGRSTPTSARLFDFEEAFPWLFDKYDNSQECFALMRSNDGISIRADVPSDTPESELEAFITVTFAEHGVAVDFIDGN